MTLAELNQKFGIPDHLCFSAGAGGLLLAQVRNAVAQSDMALQGAHVVSFIPHGQAPLLWLSPLAQFGPGKAIRGGVPVCWPWFGAHASDASLPAHGFARTGVWEVLETRALPSGETFLRFGLPASLVPKAAWPHASSVQLEITVGTALRLVLVTHNTGQASFVLGEALHAYFHISDVASVRIDGLQGGEFLDKMADSARTRQHGPVLIERELDRVYLNTVADCLIEDPGLQRRIRIATQGAGATVVWNPWIDKATRMADLGPEGYRSMVCVETANVADNVVTVLPGEVHRMEAVYSLEPL